MIDRIVRPSIQPFALTSCEFGSSSVRMPYLAGEYAARRDQPGIAQEARRRGDRQRDEDEAQRPVPALVNGLGDGAGTELPGHGLQGDPQRRQQRADEGGDLDRRPPPGPVTKEGHCLERSCNQTPGQDSARPAGLPIQRSAEASPR